MKLLIALALVALTTAQTYGGVADSGPAYPSQPAANPSYGLPSYWPQGHYGHHGHHHRSSSSSSESRSRSRSRSRSDSKEHKKCHCKDPKKYTKNGFKKISVSYLKDKDGCRRAVLTCPFDNNEYSLYGGMNDINDYQILSTGKNVQRVIKCNKKGKWEADSIEKEDYTFKLVGCQSQGVAAALAFSATNATINVVQPPPLDGLKK